VSKLTRRELLQALGGTASSCMLLAAPPRALSAAGARGGVQPFDLSAVRLLPGPFAHAQSLDAKYLLTLEPDRLLHNFRVNAGLAPKAPVYGGWESQEPWVDIRCHGHTLGHYLSACAMMFDSTGDAAFRQRVDYVIDELKACQRDGLVCGFPDGATQLENSLSGKPFVGVPWYTMHKIFAGLRDARATDVLVSLTDWLDRAARNVPLQPMLAREHGGMCEVLADVHALTGEQKYLALAERFVHQDFLKPLAAGRDTLDGLHSNTQIPKVIGLARLHELTPTPSYSEAASFFWQRVVMRRSFATGGNGDLEHFFPPFEFPERLQSAKTMETCCAHNMLRLTRELFLQNPDVAFADYYERALYNCILASQDPDSGMMTYFQATRPGYVKLYCTPTDSFWCCTGSGMENHAKYGDSIYFHDADSLYINLFIASELTWREKGLSVTQATKFPEEGATQLTIHATRPTRLSMKIRHPSWCDVATISVNGHETRSRRPGSYVEIERTWRNGDLVEVALPMQRHLEPLPTAPEFVAVMHGPIVLAGRMGTKGLTPGADIIVNERTSGDMLNEPMAIPTLSSAIELAPYYRIAHERYNLYWRAGA
jgi:DUF1680 family protein